MVDYNKFFHVALKELSVEEDNYMNEWVYIGDDARDMLGIMYARSLGFQASALPRKQYKCICTHDIEINCYLWNKITKKIIVVGSECRKRFFPEQYMQCQSCGEETNRFYGSTCPKCLKKKTKNGGFNDILVTDEQLGMTLTYGLLEKLLPDQYDPFFVSHPNEVILNPKRKQGGITKCLVHDCGHEPDDGYKQTLWFCEEGIIYVCRCRTRADTARVMNLKGRKVKNYMSNVQTINFC